MKPRNTDQDLAVSIHAASLYGRNTVRDSDLSRLLEQWPDLRAVFEEVQWLRGETERLEDSVAGLEDKVERLETLLADYE